MSLGIRLTSAAKCQDIDCINPVAVKNADKSIFTHVKEAFTGIQPQYVTTCERRFSKCPRFIFWKHVTREVVLEPTIKQRVLAFLVNRHAVVLTGAAYGTNLTVRETIARLAATKLPCDVCVNPQNINNWDHIALPVATAVLAAVSTLAALRLNQTRQPVVAPIKITAA